MSHSRPRADAPRWAATAKLAEGWDEVRSELIELSESSSLEQGRIEVDSEYLLARGAKGT
ncbi:MAG: hypothetical protein JJE23_06710 [Thermoleophilia bacterium]|jgi:hypothetical protein|nr:hypothetical protein [Thermoleophilia bacterium]